MREDDAEFFERRAREEEQAAAAAANSARSSAHRLLAIEYAAQAHELRLRMERSPMPDEHERHEPIR